MTGQYPGGVDAREPPEGRERLFGLIRKRCGLGADELAAARLVTAWATGFISMELAGAFQLGGDVEAAFDYALDRLTSALTAG